MGYGSIGAPIADALTSLGFPVRVWTRASRSIEGVDAFAGPSNSRRFSPAARSSSAHCR
jgi:phosphoglycerate dehydrogenase-like enzyme